MIITEDDLETSIHEAGPGCRCRLCDKLERGKKKTFFNPYFVDELSVGSPTDIKHKTSAPITDRNKQFSEMSGKGVIEETQ